MNLLEYSMIQFLDVAMGAGPANPRHKEQSDPRLCHAVYFHLQRSL